MKKFLQFRGKMIPYYNKIDLAKKLNMSPSEAQSLINGDTNTLVRTTNPNNGKMIKLNLADNPLPQLLRHFGVKRISNKKLVARKPTIINKNKILLKNIGPNNFVELDIEYDIQLVWPSPGALEWRTPDSLTYRGYVDEIKDFMERAAEKYAEDAGATLVTFNYKMFNRFDKKQLHWKDGRLASNIVYNLTEWANICYYDDLEGNNCVRVFLLRHYPKLKPEILKLGNNDGVTLREIITFCHKNNIKFRAYDVIGTLKCGTNVVDLDYTGLSFICYNNHIYPLNGPVPVKKKFKKITTKIVPNIMDLLHKFLKKKIIPSSIMIMHVPNDKKLKESNIKVVSFRVNDIKYIENHEYNYCLDILKKFNLESFIYDNINKNSLPSIIEKIYIKANIDSFIPNQKMLKKPGYSYSCDEIDPTRKISQMDPNLCYARALAELTFLAHTDWRTAKLTKITNQDHKMIDHFFYRATPTLHSFPMPDRHMYSGEYLKYCRSEGIEFTIDEELEAIPEVNNYGPMFEKMLEFIDYDTFKAMIVRYMGKFAREPSIKGVYEFSGIFNEDFSKRVDGYSIPIEQMNLKFEKRDVPANLTNRKLIDIQLKDQARRIIYEKMKELKLRDSDIVQIKTDSIAFYGKLPNGLCAKKWGFWKSENKEIVLRPNGYNELSDPSKMTFFQVNTKNRKRIRNLHNRYAGSGKTTEIIKKIKDEGITDYIILSNSHQSLTKCRYENMNCDVIQKFILGNYIPKENYIFIDEFGCCIRQAHDLLYGMSKMKKNFECYGDFGQLFPYGEKEECDSLHYNQYLFNNVDNIFTNYRNNFSKEYYDKLQNCTSKDNLIKEVNRWSTKNLFEADVILCYRNITKRIYNEMMIDYLGKKWMDVGNKYICKTNKLFQRFAINDDRDIGIWNHKILALVSFEGDLCKMVSEDNLIYLIKKSELKSNFDLAYALNLHQFQGSDTPSFYWTPEDNWIFGNNECGRNAYTLISRLKVPLTNKKIHNFI